MKMLQLKICKSFHVYKEGQIIDVQMADDGVLLNQFWRNRLRDSKIDGCVELLSTGLSSDKPKKGHNKHTTED